MEHPSCIQITIVGVLPPVRQGDNDKLSAFIQAVRDALDATWPDFIPARQPVTVTVVDLVTEAP